jgi:hypothetical protein
MTKNNKKLLKEEEIPIALMNKEVYEKINVIVDGYEAECFIVERWGSNKIVILYKKLHPRWGGFFTTKYFIFENPGIMGWGHNNEKMKIKII